METLQIELKKGVIISLTNIRPNGSVPHLFEELVVKSNKINEEVDGSFFFNIFEHDSKKLKSERYRFGQDYFEKLDSPHTDEKTKNEIPLYPIIHICNCDINILKKGRYTYVHKPEGKKEVSKNKVIYNRSACIMDNSIWNYFIGLKTDEYDAVINRVLWTINEIVKNSLKGIYRLYISREYADLNARMVKESYLIKGGHDKTVSPFIFHSESCNDDELLNIKAGESSFKEVLKNKWRVLLIDDKAAEFEDRKETYLKQFVGDGSNKIYKYQIVKDRFVDLGFLEDNIMVVKVPTKRKQWGDDLYNEEQKLRGLKDTLETEKYKAKREIIKNKIASVMESKRKDDNKKSQIEIWVAASLDDALRVMRMYEFEIILLDYLLDVPEDRKIGVEYGYEIFDRLVSKEGIPLVGDYRFGPKGRLFFTFISAFTTAVNERLLAENISRSEKYWFIADGACPTNTPKLFDFLLAKMMMKRLQDSHISDLSVSGIIDTVSKIYSADGVSRRKKASESYQDIQSLQYHYRGVLRDVEVMPKSKSVFETAGSVLITEFMNKHIQLGAFLEHLAQLIHITAFGTIRQWPEMWEEYMYFKSQLKQQVDPKDKKMSDDFDKMCNDIEDYIQTLKLSAL